MIRRPPRSTPLYSSAASDVYKRQGLVACTSIDDYENDIIKKHEFTRPEKEQDRINNFDHCDANTAPIFLSYRKNDKLNTLINEWIKFNKPVYDFTSEDDVTHIIWVIDKDD